MTESRRLKLALAFCFLINSFWNHRLSMGIWRNEHGQKLAFKALIPWEGLEAQTHTLPAHLEDGRESGRGGCSTDSCTSRGETFHSHALFFLFVSVAEAMWECGGHTVFVCTLREARIICMVCYKLSRAAIACQNSSTCVCVTDCGSVGMSLGLQHPLTHSRQQFEIWKNANYIDINININIYITNILKCF